MGFYVMHRIPHAMVGSPFEPGKYHTNGTPWRLFNYDDVSRRPFDLPARYKELQEDVQKLQQYFSLYEERRVATTTKFWRTDRLQLLEHDPFVKRWR